MYTKMQAHLAVVHKVLPKPNKTPKSVVLSVTFRLDAMHLCVFVAKRISVQQKQAAIDIADDSREESFGKYNLLISDTLTVY